MWALFKLQTRTHFKNPSSMMGIIIMTILLAIFAGIAPNTFSTSVAAVLSISLISMGIMQFGFSLLELRKSVIFKRIGSTAITKPQAMFSLFSFSAFTFLIDVLYAFGLVALFDISGYAAFD